MLQLAGTFHPVTISLEKNLAGSNIEDATILKMPQDMKSLNAKHVEKTF